jgi:hypothetical protein
LIVRDWHDDVLLRSTISFDLPLPPKSYFYAEAGDVNGDECADVVVTVRSPAKIYDVVIDGASGAMLWSDTIGSRPGSASVIDHDATARSC